LGLCPKPQGLSNEVSKKESKNKKKFNINNIVLTSFFVKPSFGSLVAPQHCHVFQMTMYIIIDNL